MSYESENLTCKTYFYSFTYILDTQDLIIKVGVYQYFKLEQRGYSFYLKF